MDVLKEWKIDDDNVKYVKGVSIDAHVHQKKIDSMEIKITEL
jgi:hypothetical protein